MKYFKIIILITILSSCNKPVKTSNDTYEISKLKVSYINLLQAIHAEAEVNVEDLTFSALNFYNTYAISHFALTRDRWMYTYKIINYLGPFRNINSSLATNFAGFDHYLDLTVTQPEYIDRTIANPTDGIVVNPALCPLVNETSLINLHQSGSIYSVSLGFHALEFILWGEDLSNLSGGSRTTAEFTSSDTYGSRRRDYLIYCCTNLRQHFLSTKITDNFKNSFLDLDNVEALQYMLSGVYRFTKYRFAEDLIKKPYDSQSQLDESSQFSDNSMNDIRSNLEALKNVLFGSTYFNQTDGYFLMDYVKFKSPDIYASINNKIDQIEDDIYTINSYYFDVAITNAADRVKLLSIYNSLIGISEELKTFATSVGVSSL